MFKLNFFLNFAHRPRYATIKGLILNITEMLLFYLLRGSERKRQEIYYKIKFLATKYYKF